MIQKNKRFKKIVFLIIALLIIVVAAASSLALLGNHYDQYVDEKPVVADDVRLERDEETPSGEWVVAPDEPRYMSIEKLRITNARVVGLGVKSGTASQLDDPKNIHDVGWYNKSVKPGRGGNDGLAGLYDGHNTGYSADGVFVKLGRLAVGDLIKLERGDGEVFYYEVKEVEMPILEEVDMEKMRQSAIPGREGLNIISCGGEWDAERQVYTHRVTVRAVLQS